MSALMLSLPPVVAELLAALHAAGHSAYVVGGCVRDSLLGDTPKDWDICTSALPEQTKRIFAGDNLVLTGEKHGTVAVVRGGEMYEITTYRVDGAYTDHRRPDAVRFVPDVREDLARRDFTINAMAYAPEEGLIDAFGGQADLAARRIRCVGDPAARFGEDALRILRALRFAARLDCTLDPATAAAALALRDSVALVAVERVYTELDKLLAGPACGRVLREYGMVLTGVLPEIAPCIGCTQPGGWHRYDVWDHTAMAVGAAAAVSMEEQAARTVRWTMLLHDLAKPGCRSVDRRGHAHFYGHNQRGETLAKQILQRLKTPGYLLEGVPALVAIHDMPLPEDEPGTLRLMSRYGPAFLLRLCAVKQADLAAHAPTKAVTARGGEVRRFAARVRRLARDGCYTLGRLQVTGADVLAAGVRPGPMVGTTLQTLLEAVMDGKLPNDRAALLEELRRQTAK